MLSILGSRPDNLGLLNGQLRPCPGTPNCVCSQSQSPQHTVSPIRFDGSAQEALRRIRQAILAQPRTQIITDDGHYIHAENRSPLFRFVDDIELYIDPDEQLIQIRSASRIGKSDLGVNRARVEAIRAEFARLERSQTRRSAPAGVAAEAGK